MANIANQTKFQGAIIGGMLLMGYGEFAGSDASGELDLAGLTAIRKLTLTPVKASRLAIAAPLGAVSAAHAPRVIRVVLPRVRGSISQITVTPTASVATSDSAYWTIGAVNKGASGSSSVQLALSNDLANSTRTTGGSALTAGQARQLVLNESGSELQVSEGQIIEITIAAAGASASTAVSPGEVMVNLIVAGSYLGGDETVYLDEAANARGEIDVPADGRITLTRTGASKSFNLGFFYEAVGY